MGDPWQSQIKNQKSKILLACCLVAGCSKYVPAEGTVTFDGQPLDEATIICYPVDKPDMMARGGQPPASAQTDGEGRFRLESHNKQGVTPGKYKVVVSKRALPSGVKPPTNLGELIVTNMIRKESVPAAYMSEKATPLEIDIPKGGKKDLQIEVRSALK